MEGCYIPFDWANDFEPDYLSQIRYYCLVMSEAYITNHFADIQRYANVIEHRIDDSACTMEQVLRDNVRMLQLAQAHGVEYILIHDAYKVE